MTYEDQLDPKDWEFVVVSRGNYFYVVFEPTSGPRESEGKEFNMLYNAVDKAGELIENCFETEDADIALKLVKKGFIQGGENAQKSAKWLDKEGHFDSTTEIEEDLKKLKEETNIYEETWKNMGIQERRNAICQDVMGWKPFLDDVKSLQWLKTEKPVDPIVCPQFESDWYSIGLLLDKMPELGFYLTISYGDKKDNITVDRKVFHLGPYYTSRDKLFDTICKASWLACMEYKNTLWCEDLTDGKKQT